MVTIKGAKADINPNGEVQSEVYAKMCASGAEYAYDYKEQLLFELETRAEIQNAALLFKDCGMTFAVFENSSRNAAFWNRTDNGGFRLKSGVKPSGAINDIFINGGAYASECATAITIIYYKALLEVYKSDKFDEIFPKVYLMDWDIREPLLARLARTAPAADVLTGDRGYFANPDHDPDLPQWQGENVIVMQDGMFFGHGIGYADKSYFLKELNAKRKKGSGIPSYFVNEIGRPDYKKLADAMYKPSSSLSWKPFPPAAAPMLAPSRHSA